MKKIITFLALGVMGAIASLFLEIIFSLSFPEKVVAVDYFQKFTFFLVLVVAIEEFWKVALLWKGLGLTSSKDPSRMGMFLGLGFGLSEFMIRNSYTESNLSVGQISALIVHVLTASLAGYILSRKNLSQKTSIFLAFGCTFILHIAYNLMVIYLPL